MKRKLWLFFYANASWQVYTLQEESTGPEGEGLLQDLRKEQKLFLDVWTKLNNIQETMEEVHGKPYLFYNTRKNRENFGLVRTKSSKFKWQYWSVMSTQVHLSSMAVTICRHCWPFVSGNCLLVQSIAIYCWIELRTHRKGTWLLNTETVEQRLYFLLSNYVCSTEMDGG